MKRMIIRKTRVMSNDQEVLIKIINSDRKVMKSMLEES